MDDFRFRRMAFSSLDWLAASVTSWRWVSRYCPAGLFVETQFQGSLGKILYNYQNLVVRYQVFSNSK